jgi:hypothetical protein
VWIAWDGGWLSVVEDPKDPRYLTVRARVRSDLDRLRSNYLPRLGATQYTPRRDYAYRARTTRKTFGSALAKMAARIDYPNFKEAVRERQGPRRASIYSNIWFAGLDLGAIQGLEEKGDQVAAWGEPLRGKLCSAEGRRPLRERPSTLSDQLVRSWFPDARIVPIP